MTRESASGGEDLHLVEVGPEIHGILRDMVSKWAVRILLECFLVLLIIEFCKM